MACRSNHSARLPLFVQPCISAASIALAFQVPCCIVPAEIAAIAVFLQLVDETAAASLPLLDLDTFRQAAPVDLQSIQQAFASPSSPSSIAVTTTAATTTDKEDKEDKGMRYDSLRKPRVAIIQRLISLKTKKCVFQSILEATSLQELPSLNPSIPRSTRQPAHLHPEF